MMSPKARCLTQMSSLQPPYLCCQEKVWYYKSFRLCQVSSVSQVERDTSALPFTCHTGCHKGSLVVAFISRGHH